MLTYWENTNYVGGVGMDDQPRWNFGGNIGVRKGRSKAEDWVEGGGGCFQPFNAKLIGEG